MPKTWEQRKFGDVGSVSMCKRIFKNETSDNGEIPFYKIGTFGGEPDAYISRELFEEYKGKFSYPNKGDILLSASGTIGRIVEYDGEEAYFQDSNIVWLSHDKSVCNKFLKVLYPIVRWDGIEGSTIQRLYNDNFLKTRFMMPGVEEQEKIGEYFSRLDNLITLHQRKDIMSNRISRIYKSHFIVEDRMLKIIFGNCEEAIYNTAVYFKNTYQDDWITDELSIRMIEDVDKSMVVGPRLIQSPVLGAISPRELSGGVKTLILVNQMQDKIFNASTCGDNCAKWLLEIGRKTNVTVNLRHIMDFGVSEFEIEVVNNHQVVHNMKELLDVADSLI